MVDLLNIKFLFSVGILLIAVMGGSYPLSKRKKEHDDPHALAFGETLSTGVFLGAALLHMLPEAHAHFHALGYTYPFAFLIAGGVFLFFLWFEHLGEAWYQQKNRTQSAFALLALVMLSLHSLMSGAALGLNKNQAMMTVIFLAIIAHKWAESFAMAAQLVKSGLSRSVIWFSFGLFCVMTPLGVLAGNLLEHLPGHDAALTPALVAASAGTFLYLGTLHGLDRCVLVARCCHLRDFTFVILGFLLMGVVACFV